MESFKRLENIQSFLDEKYQKFIVKASSTLIMNYINTSDLKQLKFPNISYSSTFKNQSINAQKIGLGQISTSTKKYDIVIVSIPKARDEALANVVSGYKKTKIGGIFVVEGNKDHGVDALIKRLSKIMEVEHIISKDHGKILFIKVVPKEITIFSDWSKYNIPRKNMDGFFSMPGLFSYKKADAASQFLSTSFDEHLKGDVIDIGSGWGFLSSQLLKKSLKVKSVTLLDHDSRAIDCAKANIKNPKAKFEWMDIKETNQLNLKFDYAVCNPPFHSSKGRDIELGKKFVKAASQVLKGSGTLLLVANIQLPYESLVKALFNEYRISTQNKYFKIILAKKPIKSVI